jgi:hypothetical protein
VYVSAPLVKLIKRQIFEFDPRELSDEMKMLRAEVDAEADKRFKREASDHYGECTP